MTERRQAVGWVFIIHMAQEEDYDTFDCAEIDGLKYAAWQLEMGEANGTLHWQGYLHFKEKVSDVHIHKQPGLERCAPKMRKGTTEEAVDYSSKSATRLEGPFYWPDKDTVMRLAAGLGRGKRNDITHLCELVLAGKTDTEILDIAPRYIFKFQKHIDHVRLAMPAVTRKGDHIDSVVYYGPTGTGKSHRLQQECPPGPEWFWVSPGKWFDGYQGQPGLVFDEFRGSWQTHSYMLKLLDLYPFSVERKGGHLKMRATRFRFSSNEHPCAWWEDRPGCPPWAEDPMRRRLRRVIYMNEPYVAPDEAPIEDDHREEWLAARGPRPAAGAARQLFGVSMK